MDTPKNFWPPYVGKEFVPPGIEPPLKPMNDREYAQALSENPELYWHPDFMTSPNCPSRDFKYVEPYQETNTDDNARFSQSRSSNQSFFSVPSHAPGSHLSKGYMNSMREGSVYLDAYTGDE